MNQSKFWSARKKPYEGILKEPMRADGGVVQFAERLGALVDHYGLPRKLSDPANLLNLVLALSTDHVPGFQLKTPTKPGRKATRVPTDIVILVDLSKAEDAGKSVKNAARLLAQKHPDWQLQGSSIRQRYYDLKKGGPEMRRVVELLGKL